MERAQEQNQRQANKKRRRPDFHVDDYVWLSTENLSIDRPSRKLSAQQAGPFKIRSKRYHSYELELPASWKIHNVFHASLLRKAATNPLPGQVVKPPAPINVTGEDEWEISNIVAVKLLRKSLWYRTDWLGHDEDPEWYLADTFKYAPEKIRDFHLANPTKPGPPARLQDWLDAFQAGKDDYEDLHGSQECTKASRASFFRRGGNVAIRTVLAPGQYASPRWLNRPNKRLSRMDQSGLRSVRAVLGAGIYILAFPINTSLLSLL